jgi:hypothetical protein
VLPFVQKKKELGFLYFILAVSFLLVLMGTYTIIRYYRNAPKIKISEKQITFNNSLYRIEDIEQIRFTGKQPFPYLITFPMEGTEIIFKNGEVKYIYDDMYSNTDLIKVTLESKFLKREKSLQPLEIEKIDIEMENIIYFKGNPFINLRALMLLPITVLFLFILVQSIWIPGLLILVLFLGLLLYGIITQLCYFGISKKHFVIRNHYLRWQAKIYQIDNIKEITFETQGNLPNILRLTTKMYKSNKFPASSLTDKNWLDLKMELERNNVIVKNECIIDNNEL